MSRLRDWLRFGTAAMVLAGVVLLAGFVVLGNCHIGMTLHSQRLASCTASTVRFTVRAPDHGGQLLLGLPQPSPTGKPPPFRGEVVLRRGGREVLRFPVVSWNVQTGNWLEGHGQAQTYFLTEGHMLGDVLKARETYEGTVTFTHLPPASASLWLAYVQ